MQAGVTVGSGVSVGSIFGVAVGGGVSVGVAVAGFPHDEISAAMARKINNCLFMDTHLCKEVDADEYSSTKLAEQLCYFNSQ